MSVAFKFLKTVLLLFVVLVKKRSTESCPTSRSVVTFFRVLLLGAESTGRRIRILKKSCSDSVNLSNSSQQRLRQRPNIETIQLLELVAELALN